MNNIEICSVFSLNMDKEILGYATVEDVKQLQKIAEQKRMECLSWIEPYGITYFNESQLITIQNELNQLRNDRSINLNLFEFIQKGIDRVIKDREMEFLRFENLTLIEF